MKLRVATYNILDGGRSREQLLADILLNINADVVIIQELFDTEWLEGFAKRHQLQIFVARSNTKRRVGIISKYPISNTRSFHPFPPILKTSLFAKVHLPNQVTLNVLGIHLVPFPHLIFELWRLWELSKILNQVKEFEEELWIMAGDFNAVAPNDPVHTQIFPPWLKLMIRTQANHIFRFALKKVIDFGFHDCFRRFSTNDGFTLPANHPNSRLDFIFASSLLVKFLAQCKTGENIAQSNLASDHLPVIADFQLSSEHIHLS